MNKVLRKRLLRDLKSNSGRYLALFLLIVMGIYLVVSIVGASELIMRGTEDRRSKNLVEDGQFTTFLPLSELDLSKLKRDGTLIEEVFSIDLKTPENAMLRLFKNREQMDLIQLDTGRLASADNEAVIEKGYAEAHDIRVGDTITAGSHDLTITGIGSVPDYDMCIAKFSDTAVDREAFGLLFVTPEQYDRIKESGDIPAEEYTYAYRLGDTDHDTLKEKIRSIQLDPAQVENVYFRETIDALLDDRRRIEDGINDLYDGANELSDGLSELTEHDPELCNAADKLFTSYLSQANASLAAQGITLTEENYAETLTDLIELTRSPDLISLKESLDDLAEFRDGIREYTDGASEAAKGSAELSDGVRELRDNTTELLDEVYDLDINILTSFVKADDNIRIAAAAGDVVMDRNAGLVAGIIILVLFAYVISVFVVHQIEQEQSVIGALYALGVKKKDLLLHYITLPSIVAFAAGMIGAVLGFSPLGAGTQVQDSYAYFSIPEFPMVYPPYLVIYALILPPVICAVVNALVIDQKLSRTALSLIKNERSAGSYRQFDLKTKSFPKLFAIRQLVRESRSAVTMLLGMLVSLMIMMLGLDCLVMCCAIQNHTDIDTKYSYQYLYKYPEETVPKGGEPACIETLSTDCMGYTLDVTVIGIGNDNPFFDAKPEKGKTKAVINDALAERYGYKIGDRVTFTDKAADTDHSFTVTGISDYSVGFTIFMDIDSMRELFGQEEDYFNAVYADKALDIDEGRLYSVTTKGDIVQSSGVFVKLMLSTVITMLAAGIVVFCVVMYLMMGVMIDRSAMGISLIKIFGYRPKEIRSLYLNGNLLVVAAGGLIVVPLSKFLMDAIYPSFIPNVACSIKLAFPWYLYVAIYAGVLLIYCIINRILIGKINKISPAEVLKNRE